MVGSKTGVTGQPKNKQKINSQNSYNFYFAIILNTEKHGTKEQNSDLAVIKQLKTLLF